MTVPNPDHPNRPQSDSPPTLDDRSTEARADVDPIACVLLARTISRSFLWLAVAVAGILGGLLVVGFVMLVSASMIGSPLVNMFVLATGVTLIVMMSIIYYRAWKDRNGPLGSDPGDHASAPVPVDRGASVRHGPLAASPETLWRMIRAAPESLAFALRQWIATTTRPTESRIRTASTIIERLFILDKGPTIHELSSIIPDLKLFHDTLDWLAGIDAVGYSSDRSRVWIDGDFKKSLVEAGLNARELRKRSGFDG